MQFTKFACTATGYLHADSFRAIQDQNQTSTTQNTLHLYMDTYMNKVTLDTATIVSEWVSSVLRPLQHIIGYTGDGFYSHYN